MLSTRWLQAGRCPGSPRPRRARLFVEVLEQRAQPSVGLVSVTSAGTAVGLGDANGYSPFALSASGRFVAFSADAGNLTTNDTNHVGDIFVRDLISGTTTLVSVNSAGSGPANYRSNDFAISGDGRFVAFSSYATDLVPSFLGYNDNVFVRDMVAGVTRVVSLNRGGFGSNGSSYGVRMSADGRYVAFLSSASDLVPGDADGGEDIFVRDLATGTTTLVAPTSSLDTTEYE